ncbi:hypothetical protein ACH4SK_14830 [Streptomyces inhibens]|uniref:hypothetical protein n=1 Tax=Streptomyces inhibens TaxID=2293571 RepID=UPI0037B82363
MAGTAGNLVHGGVLISCPHGGRAVAATAAGAGVRIDGAPVATAADLFTVSGCTHMAGGRPQPCTSVRWTPAAGGDAVRVDGVPVLLDTAAAMCFSAGLVPQGPPVVASVHQGHQVCQGHQGVSSR